jgi:hypothetical protein
MRYFIPLGIAAVWLPLAAMAEARCATDRWGRFLNPEPQTYEIREVISDDPAATIVSFVFGELQGDYAKVWLFTRFEGDCMTNAVSLGSYAYLLDPAQPDAPRTYHLDLYAPDTHATLGFYDTKPGYEEIRAAAVEVLSKP